MCIIQVTGGAEEEGCHHSEGQGSGTCQNFYHSSPATAQAQVGKLT